MTEAYRTAELARVRQERDAARRIFARAEEDLATGDPRLVAAYRLAFIQAEEELNFWQAKVAFLSNVRGE